MAKYSLIFAETQSANGSWPSEYSYLDILLLEKGLRLRSLHQRSGLLYPSEFPETDLPAEPAVYED